MSGVLVLVFVKCSELHLDFRRRGLKKLRLEGSFELASDGVRIGTKSMLLLLSFWCGGYWDSPSGWHSCGNCVLS